MHTDSPHQPQGVDCQMWLVAGDLLASVVAAIFAPSAVQADWLSRIATVDVAATGVVVPAKRCECVAKRPGFAIARTRCRPFSTMGSREAVVVRDKPGADHIQDRVDDLATIDRRSPLFCSPRKQPANDSSLLSRQVAGIIRPHRCGSAFLD